MIANLPAVAAFLLLFTGPRDNNASPTGVARMTVSKMRMADLESSAGGYAYNQRPGLPVAYVRYTNHGSGRYYHAPAPVHYVVGSPAPVAPAVSETALPHEPPVLLATTRHEIAPYAARQPYPRDGFINYGAGQLAKYAQPLEPPKPAARAPYYTPSAFQPAEASKSVDKRSDGGHAGSEILRIDDNDDNGSEDEEYDDGEEDGEESEDGREDRGTESREETTTGHAEGHEPPSNIDVSFERADGIEYSAGRNSSRGGKSREEYEKREKFDIGERGRYDKGGRLEHYDTETENKKGHGDVAGNYGRRDEAAWGEKGGGYGQTSCHKKGQKTSGFHKVYHKDEYKKNTDFYDESHKKGYFDKHAASDGHYNSATGEFEKSENRESGFDQGNNGEQGYRDKERIEYRKQGYEQKKGENSSHANHDNFHSDEDTRLTEKRAYRKSDGRH